MESMTRAAYGIRRKRQWLLSPGPDFSVSNSNWIINTLIGRVLKLAPDTKVEYNQGRSERITNAEITGGTFKIVVTYAHPYIPISRHIPVPPAEISAELSVTEQNPSDAKMYNSLASIVRKL